MVDVHIMIITVVFYGGHVVCVGEHDDDIVTRCSAVGGGDKKRAGNTPVLSRPFQLAARDCVLVRDSYIILVS